MNISPEWITSLKDDEIFVFGSNESGRHGKGAAKMALRWGALYGYASGIQGRTYGIPTVNASISNKLKLEKIKKYVDIFTDYASKKTDYKFLVTEVGCGLAGWSVKDIAPLFKESSKLINVYLPKSFWRVLAHESN
jgi:hypothetical protein